jgi:hypothetical protein
MRGTNDCGTNDWGIKDDPKQQSFIDKPILSSEKKKGPKMVNLMKKL